MAYNLMDLRRRIIASQPNDITREGSIVSFGTNIVRPLQVTCALSPVQSGSGDPSPSNIRPITGWTGCDVTGAGVNLFDKTDVTEGKCINGDSLVNKTWGNVSDYINVKAGVTYYLSNVVGASSLNAGSFFDINKNYVNIITTPTGSDASFSVTIPDGVAYVRLNVRNTHLDDAMLEVGSSASSYSVYTGTTIPIVWTEAGTVYGGTMTLNRDGSVTVVVTHVGVDMGSLTWNYSSTYSYFTAVINDIKVFATGESSGILCEQYKTIPTTSATGWGNADDFTIGTRQNIASVVVKDSRYTDKTAFTTAVTGKKVVYPLATPLTYTLSASVLNSLAGQNNVWASAGDVSVKAWGF